MYKYGYMFMCVCVLCMYMGVCVHMYVYICLCTHVYVPHMYVWYMSDYMCINVFMWLYVNALVRFVFVSVYIYFFICMYLYVYICMNVCICVEICLCVFYVGSFVCCSYVIVTCFSVARAMILKTFHHQNSNLTPCFIAGDVNKHMDKWADAQKMRNLDYKPIILIKVPEYLLRYPWEPVNPYCIL